MRNPIKGEVREFFYRFIVFLNELVEAFNNLNNRNIIQSFDDHYSYGDDLGGSDETYYNFYFGLKPIWAKGKQYYPLCINFYINRDGLYQDYPIWIECNSDYDFLLQRLESEFQGCLVDRENYMVGIEWLFDDNASEVDIKKAVIDFVAKIEKVIKNPE